MPKRPDGPMCQSCGMPLSEDPGGGGTMADGSIHPEYCSRCLKDGAWTEPDITAEQMREKVRGLIKQERNFPDFIVNRFTKDIPNLKRWTEHTPAG